MSADARDVLATERRVYSTITVPWEGPGFTAWRSDVFPTFYDANRIEILAPSARDLAHWEAVWRERFNPRLHAHRHLSLLAPAGQDALANQARAAGWDVTRHSLMAVTDDAAAPPVPPGLTVRAFNGDDGWERLLQLKLAEARSEPWFTTEGAFRAFFRAFRVIADTVGVRWVYLCDVREDLPLAKLGIFLHDGVARFQDISTRADLRGRGLGGALIGETLRWAFQEAGARAAALIAEADAAPERLYRRLGFHRVGETVELLALPPQPPSEGDA